MSSVLGAQSVAVGVKGGGFLSDRQARFEPARRYAVGPVVEFETPLRIAVEANALYSRLNGTSALRTSIVDFGSGNSWEFPVLGKYYMTGSRGSARPFVSAGYTMRKVWYGSNELNLISRIAGIPNIPGVSGSSALERGPLLAGGVAMRFGRFTLAPEFRYTRWTHRNLLTFRPDEFQAMVGLTF